MFRFVVVTLADARVFLAGAVSPDVCCFGSSPLTSAAGGACFFAPFFSVVVLVVVVVVEEEDLLDRRVGAATVAAGFCVSLPIEKSNASWSVVVSPSPVSRESLELRLRSGRASVTRTAVDFFAAAVVDDSPLSLLDTSPKTARDCLVRRPEALVTFGMIDWLID